jgi:thiol-disulfide isomerase/thioredoxin
MDLLSTPIAPDEIGLDFAPRRVDDLFESQIGAELVVVGGRAKVVSLNPTAAMVFRFLDGEATLAELVDDLSEELGLDRATVESDVLTFARELGRSGLLEGVEVGASTAAAAGLDAGPPGLEVGGEVEDLTLPDLDGAERSLSELRGRRVLLVNWSPGCGFCVKIADELGRLQTRLADNDVTLAFLAVGDADANRALFAAAGLDAPVLLRDGTEVDPFRSTGTPAAYLLDGAGRIATGMVVGADRVPMLARELAGADGLDADDAGGVDSGVRYLAAPAAMCGAGGGGTSSTEWAGTRAYRFGNHHVGVRYDSDASAEVLDRLFPGARVTDHRVPDNYAVALDGAVGAPGFGGARALHLLVRGGTQLVRSRSVGRVLAGLVGHLSADLDPPDPRLALATATAMVWEGQGVLLPPHLVDRLQEFQPRWSRAGLRLVDAPRASVDLAGGELVVREPTIAFDAAVVDELDDGAARGSELPRVAPGRHPLRGWCFLRAPDQVGPLSPATAVTAALSSLPDLPDDAIADTVATLASLFERVPAVGVSFDGPPQLVEQVVTFLG